jgi:hypothetical protein
MKPMCAQPPQSYYSRRVLIVLKRDPIARAKIDVRLDDIVPLPASMVACATEVSLRGLVPESWQCVDCGIDTAPGFFNRAEMEEAIRAAKATGTWPRQGVKQEITDECEVFSVREAVWARAGMEPMGGCLCIGCLEERLGRMLKPKDFPPDHSLNWLPLSTPRLLKRQKRVRLR